MNETEQPKKLTFNEMMNLEWNHYKNKKSGLTCPHCGSPEYDTYYYDKNNNCLGWYGSFCLIFECWNNDPVNAATKDFARF